MAIETQDSVPLAFLKKCFDGLSGWAQFLALTLIALVALHCFSVEIIKMFDRPEIHLGDLLMLFLFTEVVVMAHAAMHTNHDLMIAMPIAIAIVALARYMVVSPEHDPQHQILYAGAVFVLVLALFVWRGCEYMKIASTKRRAAKKEEVSER